jgi:hypothetical protein
MCSECRDAKPAPVLVRSERKPSRTPAGTPVRVTRREWMLDPEGDEAHVTVYLDELDDDEVGQGSGELLLDSGWVRRAES